MEVHVRCSVLHMIILNKIEICYITIFSRWIEEMLWEKNVTVDWILNLICHNSSFHRRFLKQRGLLAPVLDSTKVWQLILQNSFELRKRKKKHWGGQSEFSPVLVNQTFSHHMGTSACADVTCVQSICACVGLHACYHEWTSHYLFMLLKFPGKWKNNVPHFANLCYKLMKNSFYILWQQFQSFLLVLKP